MAIYPIGTIVGLGTTSVWANNQGSNNLTVSKVFEDMYPAQTAPYSMGSLRSTNMVYNTLTCGTGGSISLTLPYTVAAQTTDIVVKNFDLNTYTLTAVATPTYPYTFLYWEAVGLDTLTYTFLNATLTVTAVNFESHNHYQLPSYAAVFTTTHITP